MTPRRRAFILTGLSAIAMVVAPSSSHASRLAEDALMDMSRPSEAMPAGVPDSYDWASAPRIGAGTDTEGFGAVVPWAQAYPCAGKRFVSASLEVEPVRFRIRYAGDDGWQNVPDSWTSFGAGWFIPDYRTDEATAAPVLHPGADVARMRVVAGKVLHFWPSGPRMEMSSQQVAAVVVVFRARLRTRGITRPCVVMSAGADYWRTATNEWNGAGSNVDVGIGRLKLVGPQWRLFTMFTGDRSKARQTLAAAGVA